MSWLALLLVPLALYLAYKLVGVAIKAVLAVMVVVAVYWWAAPVMGWPTVSDLFYVFGPDFDGQRIEEVVDPANLAKRATDTVVDGVAGEVAARTGLATPEAASDSSTSEAADEPYAEPLPEPVVDGDDARVDDPD